jgi:hypothetical protein
MEEVVISRMGIAPGTFWVPISVFVTALRSFSEGFLRE